MAHHSIIFTCKDNITIPEKHQRSLNNFVSELNGIAGHGDVILYIKEEKVISFVLSEWVWDYTDDIDDLVHYVDIHRDPTGLFNVGDPLPILYSGLKEPGKPMHVTQSMPYPFPLDDLEDPTDYIGRSMTRDAF